MIKGNKAIYVNLNSNNIKVYCPYCKKMQFSKNTASYFEEQIFKLNVENETTIKAALDVICDFCHKSFKKNCRIERWCSVYFLKD